MSFGDGKKVNLIGILDDIRYFLNEKNINKKEFVGKLDYAMKRTANLIAYTSNKVTRDDILSIVSFYVADGNKEIGILVSSVIDAYISTAKSMGYPLNEEDWKYLKEIVLYYLQK